jgi:hypothetical protein
MAVALFGCRTVETNQADRPWWHPTITMDAVPWPMPTGDLEMIDYHDAHGAGWWDAPWVLAEQAALLPCYLLYGLGETGATELMGGGYENAPDGWQWRAVHWTLGIPYAVVSTISVAAVTVVDTVGHDPVAAIIWAMRD